MNYYFIGYKSSGKSTIGKLWAERVGLCFVDLDMFIEEKYGLSVPELYTRDGEDEFRKKESAVLLDVSLLQGVVVATGGGAPCSTENLAIMRNSGKIIYLKIDDELLIERLKEAAKNRPIVKGKNETELREFLRMQKEMREPFYSQADYIIEGGILSVDDVARVVGL
jgi:shikimate kinase